jgi:hypothetical protein
MPVARKLAGWLLFICSSISVAAANHNLFVSATGDCNGTGTAARPFVRLTAALARVRTLRAAGDSETVTIHVAPGQYVVSRTPQDCTIEALPIIVNVSDVRILGATELLTDPETEVPTMAIPGGSDFVAAEVLTGGEALLLVTPDAAGNPPERVRVSGLSLQGVGLVGHGLFLDRAQDFVVQGNVTMQFLNGIRTRGASGKVLGNLTINNHDTGMVITAGSKVSPAAVDIRANRACGAELGILLVATGAYALSSPGAAPLATQFDPSADADTIPNQVVASLRNNVMCSNTIAGLRVFAIGQLGNAYTVMNSNRYDTFVTIDSRGNHFSNNFYGISLDGGFPRRSPTFSYSTVIQAGFREEVASGSVMANTFLGFVRLQVALGTVPPRMFEPLSNSSMVIEADGNLLESLNFSHPAVDGITGAVLDNHLTVNGLPIPNGSCIGVCPDPIQ